MYKLLIADDEETIREGLKDIVDWKHLGFEVAAVFSDGESVLDYLRHNNADALLTDIKMDGVSGLDVAEHIQREGLATKVILITGYQELQLAMTAIRCGVRGYILKPVNIDELAESFRELQRVLDEENEAMQRREMLELMQKGVSELKESFFTELMVGSVQHLNYLAALFHFLYPTLDFEDCPCFILTLRMEEYETFLRERWKHTNGELYTCLKNCVRLSPQHLEYCLVSKELDYLQIVGLATEAQRPSPQAAIAGANQKLCDDLREIFHLECTMTQLEIFGNLPGLLQYKENTGAAAGQSEVLMLKIREQQKMLYSTLCTGSAEATDNLLRKFISYLHHMEYRQACGVICELLETIREKLEESSLDMSHSLLFREGDAAFWACGSLPELEVRLQEVFSDLLEQVRKYQDPSTDVVEQAKKYIVEHITEDLSLEELADRFYLSQYYFSRIFKNKTGENLIDYIVRCKMDYAMELLRNKKYKVYEISNMVGYKSNRYFTRIFKNHTGYTPNAYRGLMTNQTAEGGEPQ